MRSWYHLSPFVWKREDRYALLLRGVPRRDDNPALKIARVFFGTSRDGVTFDMHDEPVIAPGPDAQDRDGCEDPTYVAQDGGAYVFYTGWNETQRVANLLFASGRDPEHLRKRGVAIASNEQRINPKEATLAQGPSGWWNMFYEFSNGGASRIGLAQSRALDQEWTPLAEPFVARPQRWDSWHLSTGPVVDDDGLPLMFYNGATRDANWRIGWIRFDERFSAVVDRCEEPVVAAQPVSGGGTDITFAASAVERDGFIRLYYSVSDQMLLCATLRRRRP